MNATYHLPRDYRYLFSGGLVFFVLFGAVCVPLAVADAPPENRFFRLALLGGVPLAMATIAAYGLLACLRHKLVVTDAWIESTGILKARRILLDEVTEARWRSLSEGGRLSLRTPRDRVTVCFGNYDPKQRTTLIRFFRTRLTESAQHDWERYWLGHWTMFDEPDRTDPERVAAQIRHARRRTDVLFLVGGILIVAVGVLSKWLQGVEHVSLGQTIAACLVGGVLWALLWTTMRSGVCPRGQVAERFPDPSAVDPVILVGLVCFVVTWVVVLTCLKLDRAPRTNILLGGAGLWGVLTLWGLTRQTRRLRGWNEEAARLAAEKYLAASPVAPQRPDSDA